MSITTILVLAFLALWWLMWMDHGATLGEMLFEIVAPLAGGVAIVWAVCTLL